MALTPRSPGTNRMARSAIWRRRSRETDRSKPAYSRLFPTSICPDDNGCSTVTTWGVEEDGVAFEVRDAHGCGRYRRWLHELVRVGDERHRHRWRVATHLLGVRPEEARKPRKRREEPNDECSAHNGIDCARNAVFTSESLHAHRM